MQATFGHDEAYWTRGKMNGAKTWAYYWWAKANQENFWGGSDSKTEGYVRQERDRILKLWQTAAK